MSQSNMEPTVRVLVASVAERRTRALDATAKIVADELVRAKLDVRRVVVVKPQPDRVRALLNNVAVDNEADAIILVGGCGIGPEDVTCATVDATCEQHIEGFGEAYRRQLRGDMGHAALLQRATAGVHDRVVIFALSGQNEHLRLAVETLIVPVLPQAVALANGRLPPPPPG